MNELEAGLTTEKIFSLYFIKKAKKQIDQINF